MKEIRSTPVKWAVMGIGAAVLLTVLLILLSGKTEEQPISGLPDEEVSEVAASTDGAEVSLPGAVSYEIRSWELVHTGQEDGTEFSNRYVYDYIVLSGEDPVSVRINKALYSLAEEKMAQIEDGSLTYPHYEQGNICRQYEEHITSSVVHNGNGIISILAGTDRAVTYSLHNGAPLGLHILAGDDQEQYLQTIRQAVENTQSTKSYVSDASALGLDDFAFAVMDGQIVILGVGSPGGSLFTAFHEMIHTGLQVSTEYTDRLQGTLRATGATGSVSYEIQEMDRSYLRLGRPDCQQSMIHVCQYPVVFGAAAAEKISQEAYDLAMQFMDSFPDEITNTSNRYQFHWECNRYWNDERIDTEYAGIQYNANGIACNVMDWKIELGYFRDGQKYIGTERYDGLHGITYDLETGEHLSLRQITGMDEMTQLMMLRDAYGRVYNSRYLNTSRLDYDPADFSLEEPAFLIDKEGQIVLHFSVTEQFEDNYLADLPKTAHTFTVTIPTELYILGS